MGKAAGEKKLPNAPLAAKSSKVKKDPIFEKTPKNFRLGGDVMPKRDLTRYVKWPKYITLQRQKRVLLMRLKVPPTINQFTHPIDKNQAAQLLKLMQKYSPETREEKNTRLRAEAKAKEAKETVQSKRPVHIK